MRQIVSACFPKAMITLDRFHHQQFCLEALQEIRIGHRREAMTEAANARDGFGAMIKDLAESGKPLVDAEGNPIRSDAAYHPERLRNNETKAELFIRSRYLLISRSGMPRWGNLTTRHLTTSLPQCTTERMRS